MDTQAVKISPSRNVAKRSGEIEAGESYFLLGNLLGGMLKRDGKGLLTMGLLLTEQRNILE